MQRANLKQVVEKREWKKKRRRKHPPPLFTHTAAQTRTHLKANSIVAIEARFNLLFLTGLGLFKIFGASVFILSLFSFHHLQHV